MINKRAKTILWLLSCCALGGAGLWLAVNSPARGRAQGMQDDQYRNPYFASIDEKAQAANAGGDEQAIRELTDEVLRHIVKGEIPALILDPFRERLVKAELRYRRGETKGVTEIGIVRVVDDLAQKFSAPDYALTSEDEVKELRAGLRSDLPHFIGPQPPPPAGHSAGKETFIQAPMSPLEAVYVTDFLLMQKRINEFYHLTRQERAAVKAAVQKLAEEGVALTPEERGLVRFALTEQQLHPEKPQRTPQELAALAQQHTRERAGKPAEARLMAKVSTPRDKEIEAAFRRAFTISFVEGIKLAHQSLDTLGIER
ncbi:MAG: hypothetical protein M3371_01095 [Acidobacteriota bacterium]|nr:hypothetical protein [Acidobacteriota bacterium]